MAGTVCVQGRRGRTQYLLLALRVLEARMASRDGRLQPITFSAAQITHCSLSLSLAPDGDE